MNKYLFIGNIIKINRRKALSYLSAGVTGAFIPWQGAQAEGIILRGYLRTNWSRDPYSYGSYSYVAKGARQRDRITLGKPIDHRVYFAGEAVHPKQNSTVHAAYESGLMVAKNVIADTSGRVAVIGAGMSGLTAAQALAKNGRAVTVFEARDRIGGRIWTDDTLGVPLDLGASWIHGTHRNPITALARQTNATTMPTDETYITRGADGRIIDDKDTPKWLEDVTRIQHEAGADRHEVNMRAFNAEPEYSGDEVIFPTGYESLLPALQGDYEVRTSEPVSEIAYDKKGVTITVKGVKTKFEIVIVTLPLGVLKRGAVTFTPELPPDKQAAISKLGMGTLDKLYLLYDRPFWDEKKTWIATPENGLPQGQFNEWLNLYKYIGHPIIMSFNGGPPALELSNTSDKKIVSLAQQTLQDAYAIKK